MEREHLASASRYLAGLIIVVAVAGVVRILTLLPGGEAELLAWVSAVVLLVGLTSATVVLTCARVLRALPDPTAADDEPEPPDTPSSLTEPPDYLTGAGSG